MYSDTLIVVISLIIMIIVGLVFRTCCLKLTSCNQNCDKNVQQRGPRPRAPPRPR